MLGLCVDCGLRVIGGRECAVDRPVEEVRDCEAEGGLEFEAKAVCEAPLVDEDAVGAAKDLETGYGRACRGEKETHNKIKWRNTNARTSGRILGGLWTHCPLDEGSERQCS
jgi:hypothetical protein